MATQNQVQVPTAKSLTDGAGNAVWGAVGGAGALAASALVSRVPGLPAGVGPLVSAAAVGGLMKGNTGDTLAVVMGFEAGKQIMQEYGGGLLSTLAGS